mmetsp:Transcript_75570/g.127096  ORF Transcript_75570/g.127096 Transcript_75570/m.127096 type:complete len:215 (+) Transcript_75570:900-1544(+)
MLRCCLRVCFLERVCFPWILRVLTCSSNTSRCCSRARVLASPCSCNPLRVSTCSSTRAHCCCRASSFASLCACTTLRVPTSCSKPRIVTCSPTQRRVAMCSLWRSTSTSPSPSAGRLRSPVTSRLAHSSLHLSLNNNMKDVGSLGAVRSTAVWPLLAGGAAWDPSATGEAGTSPIPNADPKNDLLEASIPFRSPSLGVGAAPANLNPSSKGTTG